MAEAANVLGEVEPVQPPKDVSFAVGDTFESFDALVTKIKAYQQAKFVQFWRRDARTIEAVKKRLDRYLNPSLKYYELKFCCIHGGQAFKPKGKGMRNSPFGLNHPVSRVCLLAMFPFFQSATWL